MHNIRARVGRYYDSVLKMFALVWLSTLNTYQSKFWEILLFCYYYYYLQLMDFY